MVKVKPARPLASRPPAPVRVVPRFVPTGRRVGRGVSGVEEVGIGDSGIRDCASTGSPIDAPATGRTFPMLGLHITPWRGPPRLLACHRRLATILLVPRARPRCHPSMEGRR